jgi:hypothetical protein
MSRHDEKATRAAGNLLVENIHQWNAYSLDVLIPMAAQEVFFVAAAHPVIIVLAMKIARSIIQ